MSAYDSAAIFSMLVALAAAVFAEYARRKIPGYAERMKRANRFLLSGAIR